MLVIDRAGYGTDTISTHALMRGGVLQLHRWGVLPRLREMGTPAVRETTFHYGDEAITVPIRPSNGVDALYAPRRTLLDSTLVDAAREAGAVVRHGHTLVGLTRDCDGRVCGATVLDAEGNARWRSGPILSSARMASAPALRVLPERKPCGKRRNATAVMFGYFRGIELAGYHWWYRPGVGAGAIPTNRAAALRLRRVVRPRRLRNGSVACRSQRRASARSLREADPALAAIGCRLRAG